uniref:Rhodanese domain-containing protein n=1 Tax=viral metagenome TaxID=1070528 RepID=A0A6C0JHB5_9ZZZZ
MGNTSSMNKINFEDIQYSLRNKDKYILINTLEESWQQCLLPNTVGPEKETSIINHLIQMGNKDIKIIIYGKNCNDDKIYKKYNQLQSLGFYNVYVYTGGLFEWLMLQDIYGEKEFPTSKKELDILKFKPQKKLNIQLLEY